MSGRVSSSSRGNGAPPAPESVRRVLLNAASLLLAYVLPRLFTVGAVIVAARVLGAPEFGHYGTAAALAVILSVLATLGMPSLLIREMARAPERAPELVRSAHLIKSVASVIMLASLYILARHVLRYPADVTAAALLLGLAFAVNAYVDNLMAYFQAVERMHVWTQANALNGLVTGLLGAALVLGTGSMVWFCTAPLAGQVASFLWLAGRAPADIRFGVTAAPGSSRALVRMLAPFTAAFLGMAAYYKVDVLVLDRLRPAADVGLYTAAYKFIDITQALILVFAVAVYPRLSRLLARDRAARGTGGARLAELAVLGGAVVGGGLLILRQPVVDLLYGQQYAAAVGIVGVLGLVIPALALNLVGGYILGAADRMRRVATLYGFGVALNIGLNIAFIPDLGPAGAAVAMLVSELALAGGFLVALSDSGSAPGARAVGVAVATLGVAGLAGLAPAPAPVAAVAFLAATALLWHWAHAITPAEREALRLAIRRPPPEETAPDPVVEAPEPPEPGAERSERAPVAAGEVAGKDRP